MCLAESLPKSYSLIDCPNPSVRRVFSFCVKCLHRPCQPSGFNRASRDIQGCPHACHPLGQLLQATKDALNSQVENVLSMSVGVFFASMKCIKCASIAQRAYPHDGEANLAFSMPDICRFAEGHAQSSSGRRNNIILMLWGLYCRPLQHLPRPPLRREPACPAATTWQATTLMSPLRAPPQQPLRRRQQTPPRLSQRWVPIILLIPLCFTFF